MPDSAINADVVSTGVWANWTAVHDPAPGETEAMDVTATLDGNYSALLLKPTRPDYTLSQCRTVEHTVARRESAKPKSTEPDIPWQQVHVEFTSEKGVTTTKVDKAVSINDGSLVVETTGADDITTLGHLEYQTHEEMALADMNEVVEGQWNRADAANVWTVWISASRGTSSCQLHTDGTLNGKPTKFNANGADGRSYCVGISLLFNDEATAKAAQRGVKKWIEQNNKWLCFIDSGNTHLK